MIGTPRVSVLDCPRQTNCHKDNESTFAAILAVLLLNSMGEAQTLSVYFNFTGHGAVSGGSIVTDEIGNTTGTLSSVNTTLTASGLSISTNDHASANTGLTLSAGSLKVSPEISRFRPGSKFRVSVILTLCMAAPAEPQAPMEEPAITSWLPNSGEQEQ